MSRFIDTSVDVTFMEAFENAVRSEEDQIRKAHMYVERVHFLENLIRNYRLFIDSLLRTCAKCLAENSGCKAITLELLQKIDELARLNN